MNKILLFLLLFTFLFGSKYQSYMNELHRLSYKQRTVLFQTFNKAKQFDLEYTMTAIAWQESKFGKFFINLDDPSAGVFHNLIKSVCTRHNCKTHWSMSRITERLITDYDFSFAEALAEIEFWQNYHKGKPFHWSKTVMSYNCGYDIKKKQCKQYLNEIKYKIKILKIFIKENK